MWTEERIILAPLNPANLDADAGDWIPILLTSATEFAVAAPVDTNTPEYIAQINEIKTWQQDMTDEKEGHCQILECRRCNALERDPSGTCCKA